MFYQNRMIETFIFNFIFMTVKIPQIAFFTMWIKIITILLLLVLFYSIDAVVSQISTSRGIQSIPCKSFLTLFHTNRAIQAFHQFSTLVVTQKPLSTSPSKIPLNLTFSIQKINYHSEQISLKIRFTLIVCFLTCLYSILLKS